MLKLKSIFSYLDKLFFILTKTQKKWSVVIIILTLIGSFIETLGVSAMLPLVQVMLEPAELKKYTIVKVIMDFLHLKRDTQLIWLMGIAVIAVYVLKNIYLLFLSFVRVKYACKVQRELSVEMMESYMSRGYLYFVKTSTSSLLRGMNESIGYMYLALFQTFRLLAEILTIACICIYIMVTDVGMAIVVGTLAFVCLISVVVVFRKWTQRCGETNYHYVAKINQILLQAFQGIKDVLVMQRQKFFVGLYEKNFIKRQKSLIGQAISTEGPAYLIEGMCVSGLIMAVCIKTMNANSTAMLVPELAAFAVAAFRILPSLGRISLNVNQIILCMPGVNDTYENLKEVRNAKKTLSKTEKYSVGKFENEICLKNVSWKYPEGEKNILDKINLTIKRGEAVAFVGSSGSGKTTLSDIILGLLTPQDGEVLIDGINISNRNVDWNNTIGFVPQNAYIMDDTIRNNVAFGVNEEDINDEMIWRALEQAQLKNFIEELPDGLYTLVGERGVRFSGGQRQRVVIARALYYNPDILILDEATSALDSETEGAIMDAIEKLQGEKTLIIIAHRITTIQNCDIIYKVENGSVKTCKYEELS